MDNDKNKSSKYADQLATQLRKGFLAYCMLKVCSSQPKYTSDIIMQLRAIELVVVEGTVYPLLSRLQKDGLLEYEWKESEQGPPRKYYKTTRFGNEVVGELAQKINLLTDTLERL
ncbi:MAG: PadR family transcriptional regulator [Candidatus Saccharimonas sp.]